MTTPNLTSTSIIEPYITRLCIPRPTFRHTRHPRTKHFASVTSRPSGRRLRRSRLKGAKADLVSLLACRCSHAPSRDFGMETRGRDVKAIVVLVQSHSAISTGHRLFISAFTSVLAALRDRERGLTGTPMQQWPPSLHLCRHERSGNAPQPQTSPHWLSGSDCRCRVTRREMSGRDAKSGHRPFISAFTSASAMPRYRKRSSQASG
uniref:Uncharacterized protein n=1 Tax=Mycena chlorophos TaxID=658473 RepID=A0ABQ0L752_MYCCL|nr:predicted protein [Mycena chlorophos]